MTPQIIIAGIAFLAGIFYFSFPFINKKYFQRPKLTLEIEPNTGITNGRHHVRYLNNDPDLPVNRPEVKSLYELFWKFDLIIRNNSEYDAYEIELYCKGIDSGILKFNSKPNPNVPLPKHGELVIPFRYDTTIILQQKDLGDFNMTEPEEFSRLEILLSYKNSKNTQFNTILNFRNRNLSFENISKKVLNNWR